MVERMTRQSADEQELELLEALLKGPALPVELAVRTFSLPEEIVSSLRALEAKGEVERQQLDKGEMFLLTRKGYERITNAKPSI